MHRQFILVSVGFALALLGHPLLAAVPLQDLIDRSKPAVAHVSILSDEGEEVSSGSGFVISRDGRLVTNFHVVENANQIVAVFEGDRRAEVTGVLAFDVAADLAVLQLAAGEFAPLTISQTTPKQGDPVVVIGSPKGFSGSVSTGIVSAVRRGGTQRPGDEQDAYSEGSWQLQITAATSPGSSGSPILSEDGQVVGVAVGKYRGESLNFGVPAELLHRVLARAAERRPMSVLQTGRSVTTNLLISGGVLLGLAGIFVLVNWLLRVGARRKRRAA